jgi:penicillin-binding protein 2
MNKAIQDQLAPGSTFKIIMSAAGLQEGVAQNMHVMCSGGADFYGRFFKCDHHHGLLDIHEAIPMSCDTFFYTLAQKLGIDTIAKYATEFGLSQKTGVDLPNEMVGIMPSTKWEMKNYHQRYYPGNTISVGIGQGETQVTPIQLLRGHWPASHRTATSSAPTCSTPIRFLKTCARPSSTASPAPATRPFRSTPIPG